MSSEQAFGVHIFLQKTGQKDDRLRIAWDNESNGYLITLDQYTVGNHAEVVMPYMCDVERYLQKFFDFLEIDALPYEWYQVDIPSFPAVKLTNYGLRRNRGLILDAVHGLKYDWPQESFQPKY